MKKSKRERLKEKGGSAVAILGRLPSPRQRKIRQSAKTHPYPYRRAAATTTRAVAARHASTTAADRFGTASTPVRAEQQGGSERTRCPPPATVAMAVPPRAVSATPCSLETRNLMRIDVVNRSRPPRKPVKADSVAKNVLFVAYELGIQLFIAFLLF